MALPINFPELALCLHYSSWLMIIIGLVTVFATSFVTAPYGKFTTEKGWGMQLPAKLTWMIMESPNLWMSLVLFSVLDIANVTATSGLTSLPYTQLPNQLLYAMFLIHYTNRAIIFPMFLAQGNPMPISVMLLAFSYCSWNGFNQALALLFVNTYPSDWISSPTFILGAFLFFLGLYINISADHYLLRLKAKAKKDGTGYLIPTEGMFHYVSSANYFGELVEWLGFAIACNCSVTSIAFVWYAFSNLAPRAVANHKWYQTRFPDYPKHRKAVIPFLL